MLTLPHNGTSPPHTGMQHFDTAPFLRHGLVSALLCCAIALALTISGQGAWDVQLAYSLGIGLVSWLVIDLGRAWLTRASHAAWPPGWRGLLLVAAGISAGYVLGSLIGKAYSGSAQYLPHQQGTVWPLAITIAAGGGVSFFFYSQGRARHLQARMAQTQRDAAEARLQLLQAQLEPHMLFNTLATLRVLVATDPARAHTMLDHLIAYLRATLGASRAVLHPLAEEFDRLRDYLELMAVRMGPRLTYQLDLHDALRTVPVPALLLQPLLENAIRHGLEPQLAGGHIAVQARTVSGATGPCLQLQVDDTGVGLSAGAPGTAHGFGLTQVRERLATLYGAQSALELIAASADGVSARVTFPLKSGPPA